MRENYNRLINAILSLPKNDRETLDIGAVQVCRSFQHNRRNLHLPRFLVIGTFQQHNQYMFRSWM